ncbi:MAG TPA: hypothetical protein VFA39_18415 [Steroidobacteraceae bacterium]|nr:hypothetical protein [Steroidobacteraceae bacterium]
MSGIMPLPQGGFIYLLDTLTAPDDLWRLDLRGTAARLTAVNGARLAGISWPVVRRFAFRGAGGDTVWAFGVRPTDSVGARSPVALFVYGGPQGTMGDAWSDRVNLAAWAGRGYAGFPSISTAASAMGRRSPIPSTTIGAASRSRTSSSGCRPQSNASHS